MGSELVPDDFVENPSSVLFNRPRFQGNLVVVGYSRDGCCVGLSNRFRCHRRLGTYVANSTCVRFSIPGGMGATGSDLGDLAT